MDRIVRFQKLPPFFFLSDLCFLLTEREENVKSDIFHAYIALLKQTRPVVVAGVDSMEEEEG